MQIIMTKHDALLKCVVGMRVVGLGACAREAEKAFEMSNDAPRTSHHYTLRRHDVLTTSNLRVPSELHDTTTLTP